MPKWAATAADAARSVRVISAEPKTPFWNTNRLRPVVQLADDLAAVDDATATLLIATPPPPTGETWIDVLIAATCELRSAGRRVPLPAWTEESSRFLSEPYDVEEIEALREHERQHTPRALARRNLFLHESFFVSA